MKDRQVIITRADGSQTLLWLWAGGEVEASERDHVGDTWRPVSILGGSTEVIDLGTVGGSAA